MQLKNIAILKKDKCTGCGACQNICPTNSIRMIQDKEGFQYPHINNKQCINCGKCQEVCPILNIRVTDNKLEPDIYGAWSLDRENRIGSSSGGIFSELAKEILGKKGYVVGARYNKHHLVEHCIISGEEGLVSLQKSKYIQSEIRLIFRQIKRLLEKDEYVLFVGTPCQVTGLLTFLDRKYEKLLTCDLVCHGVNSPIVYLNYLKEFEKVYKSKIESIDFRDKKNGWNNFGTKIIFENGEKYYKSQHQEPFYRGFIKNLYLRPACYECQFKTFPRYSDITLADFWGVHHSYTNIDVKEGVSLIMIHSQKGRRYFDKLSNEIFKFKGKMEQALSYNPSIKKPSVVEKEKREKFFREMDCGRNISNIIEDLI